MKIGITLPTMISDTPGDVLLEWARRADDGPYSSLAVGERITYPNCDMVVALSAAAALTHRVRLISTVAVVPLHRAALLAKQAASLDLLSNGRLTLGVGIGGRDEDCLAVGAPTDNRHKRMAEQVALMRRIWRGEPPYEGAAPIGPKPIQEGGPEILVGSIFPSAVRRTMRWADGLSGWSFEPDAAAMKETFRIATEAWQKAGRAGRPRFVVGSYYALGPRADEQIDSALSHYLGIFGADVAKSIAASVRSRTAQAILDAQRAFEDIGADEFIWVPLAAELDQLERLTEIVGR
jgi:alkanesulfonate monooxygenase SsuD/methylene tetrahydromethanopterin reductase-like flavin-dependent oxidoreductase (luciferase family)